MALGMIRARQNHLNIMVINEGRTYLTCFTGSKLSVNVLVVANIPLP